MLAGSSSRDFKTVFLVDDDSSSGNLYSNRLEQAGFRTASAFHTADAVQALPNLSADLIILDLMLPKRGGFDLLTAIRSDTRHKDTPVLLLSNTYLPEMTQRGLRAGGNKALSRSECTAAGLISASFELVGDGVQMREPDGAWAEEFKKSLFQEGTAEIASVRQQCLKYAELAGTEEGKEYLDKVYQSVRFLSARAGLVGCGKVAQLAGAI